MKLTVRSRPFPNLGQDNRSHFLLAHATVNWALSFEASPTVTLTAPRTGPSVFTLDLAAAQVPVRRSADGQPVLEQGQPSLQQLTRLDISYRADVTLGGLTFPALQIRQRLQPVPVGPTGRQQLQYTLSAGGWLDAGGRQRVANRATHPLADLSALAAGEVLLNTLMLDITAGWQQLHHENPTYQEYGVLSAGHGLNFKVFAHTAGTPLIWYAVIPDHLRGGKAVSPHVFFQPSDNREGQAPADDERYLTRNDEYFKGDGGTLMKYLLPPIPDELVPTFSAPVLSPKRKRNVVNFSKATVRGRETGEITTDHWAIGAGLQRAFEHRGDGVPAQFLLLPQRVGTTTSGGSGSYGGAVSGHLLSVTRALFGVIESNTALTAGGGDVLLTQDKLVLSAYSESGFDLWGVSRIHQDALKAIIAIEPQNMNAVQNDYRPKDTAGDRSGAPPLLGKDVIPGLLKRHVQVYVIGRHHRQYGPQISDRQGLRLLPDHPQRVFAYPPDPSVNDFIKFRIQRVLTPADDPLMLVSERQILTDLAARGVTGAAVLSAIFGPKGNQDQSGNDGVDRWYSHQFALSGGDELQLDPAGMYGRPVTYRTWFQRAVHEVG